MEEHCAAYAGVFATNEDMRPKGERVGSINVHYYFHRGYVNEDEDAKFDDR